MTTRRLLSELLKSLPTGVFCGVAGEEDAATAAKSVVLTPTEAAAFKKRHSEITQEQFLMGRLAARRALEAARAPTSAIEIASSKDGAPQFIPPYIGSIAHTEFEELTCAVALVAISNPAKNSGSFKSLGVDLEPTVRTPHTGLLARITADPVLEAWAGESTAATLTLFSVKESIYKCLHPIVQRWFGFKAAIVHRPTENGIRVVINETLSRSVPKGTEVQAGRLVSEDYVVTWASWK